MAGKSSKEKGYRGEKEIEKLLKEVGLSAKRVPLSGAVEGFWGDVLIKIKEEELRAEVKRRRVGLKALYDWLGGKDILFVREDRKDWLVILRLEDFLRLTLKEGD